MHIEVLVEDSSGGKLLQVLLPQFLGPHGEPHTWRLHRYKGIGRIPRGLAINSDPAKRMLLDQLPKLLRGYGKTAGIDAVVVVLDTDRRDCAASSSLCRSQTHRSPSCSISRIARRVSSESAWKRCAAVANSEAVGMDTTELYNNKC